LIGRSSRLPRLAVLFGAASPSPSSMADAGFLEGSSCRVEGLHLSRVGGFSDCPGLRAVAENIETPRCSLCWGKPWAMACHVIFHPYGRKHYGTHMAPSHASTTPPMARLPQAHKFIDLGERLRTQQIMIVSRDCSINYGPTEGFTHNWNDHFVSDTQP
jgi:hypothetical protein